MKHLLLTLLTATIVAPSAVMGLTKDGKQCTVEGQKCFNMAQGINGICQNGKCIVSRGCNATIQSEGDSCKTVVGGLSGHCKLQRCPLMGNKYAQCLNCVKD
jgi:hypothetical protein